MIIEQAQRYNETYGPKFPQHGNNVFWDYLSFESKGAVYRVCFELNKAYGRSLVRQWSVDENYTTTVPDKYSDGKFVVCDCSAGLCGVRPFEHDCITWEFLYKRLGIVWEDLVAFKTRHDIREWEMGFYAMREMLKELNVPHTILFEGVY